MHPHNPNSECTTASNQNNAISEENRNNANGNNSSSQSISSTTNIQPLYSDSDQSMIDYESSSSSLSISDLESPCAPKSNDIISDAEPTVPSQSTGTSAKSNGNSNTESIQCLVDTSSYLFKVNYDDANNILMIFLLFFFLYNIFSSIISITNN